MFLLTLGKMSEEVGIEDASQMKKNALSRMMLPSDLTTLTTKSENTSIMTKRIEPLCLLKKLTLTFTVYFLSTRRFGDFKSRCTMGGLRL